MCVLCVLWLGSFETANAGSAKGIASAKIVPPVYGNLSFENTLPENGEFKIGFYVGTDMQPTLHLPKSLSFKGSESQKIGVLTMLREPSTHRRVIEIKLAKHERLKLKRQNGVLVIPFSLDFP